MEQQHLKANPNASTGRPPVVFSAEARFVGGSALTEDGGGVVLDHGEVYSVAVSGMVPGSPVAEQQPDGSWHMPAVRTGKATFLKNDTSQPTTYGAELESAQLQPDGSYAPLSVEEQHEIKELYTFMRESGTVPTDDPAELERRMWEMVHQEVDAAAKAGQFVASLAVFGQHDLGAEYANSHPYVGHVVGEMSRRTGFNTTAMFRTAGAQTHTGVSNTMAGIQASEAMQYISPILATPTLSGPFVHGGIAGNLARTAAVHGFTPEQQAHMKKVGVRPDDLSHPYQSWRYLLRLLGSPSAGLWQAPAPDTEEGYIARAHQQLRNGEINNIDRTNGWHTDRPRIVLDGSGANTREDCSPDTALGNPDVLTPLHLLGAGLFTTLEQMALQGRDPRQVVARMLGIVGLSPAARLQVAHRTMLTEASRYGNDSNVYGKRPGEWLPELVRLAEGAPYTRLAAPQKTQLRRSYATLEETAPAIDRWCKEHGTNTPTAQTWFDLRLNNPAVYMHAQYNVLRRDGAGKEAAIRQVELGAGQALHAASYRNREGAK